MLTDWIKKHTTYLFPSHCELCHMVIEPEAFHPQFCVTCQLRFAPTIRCRRCGLVTPEVTEMCGECLVSPPLWTRLYCVGDYQPPLASYVHRLKYEGQYWQAKTLSGLLAPRIDTRPDLITFVPVHWRRYCYRGYNQSEHLAWQISRELAIPCDAVFKKVRSTPRQQGMDKKQRRNNVRQAFCLTKAIEVEHIAIVDDVLTTGSTVHQLCKLLLGNGVKTVDIYCICRTPEPSNR
ncbi:MULTISPECIES: ComF family protein [Vibrio]|uniref:ComF family protein n=1 Tax=Vibrio TaxID=662 RepID=UPI002076284B|nr:MULTISPECIES: ComF family protein [Vibrio]USD32655.1 ComF family protein [Vibrio sp. SCSIO 43186]USD45696.1 ComF family protein [Vibrio sp. SCSIO 43145]USD69780.1 ComF family protein [Vibrio sp. SCSIO 43139]USD94687.1 amidophosphoribosyltransferase [Vibrio coralliilyticus]